MIILKPQVFDLFTLSAAHFWSQYDSLIWDTYQVTNLNIYF